MGSPTLPPGCPDGFSTPGTRDRDISGAEAVAPPRLTIETPVPGIRVIRVSGVLAEGSGARLLRVLDSQLALVRAGRRRLDSVIVDVSGLSRFERGGPDALAHAGDTGRRRGVEVVLGGCPAGPVGTDLGEREQLRGIRMFPTVRAAVEAITTARPSQGARIRRPSR